MAIKPRIWVLVGGLVAVPILAFVILNEIQMYQFQNPDDDAARYEFEYFFEREIPEDAEIIEIARSRPSLLLFEYGGCMVIAVDGSISELIGDNPNGPRSAMSRCPNNFDWPDQPGVGRHLEHGAPLNMVHWSSVSDDFAEVYVTDDNQFALIVFSRL